MHKAYFIQTLSPTRKIIAARITEAKRTILHARLIADIAIGAFSLRKELRQSNLDGNLPLNDLLIKATDHPVIEGATGGALLSTSRRRIEQTGHRIQKRMNDQRWSVQ